MKIGKKGIGQETFVLIMFGILALMALISWSMDMMEESDAPTQYEDVMRYYDDMLGGEINGEDISATGLAMGFMIPLLSVFSMLWALLGILPVFRDPNSKGATTVLAFGIALYATPGMSWLLVEVFPNTLGISGIFIAVAVLMASLFILVSTTMWFKGLTGTGNTNTTTTTENTNTSGDPPTLFSLNLNNYINNLNHQTQQINNLPP
jgi:hypothetical protein